MGSVKPQYDYIGNIIAYEQDNLSDDETVILFQYLKDTGIVNQLQGHYGRTLRVLMADGLVT